MSFSEILFGATGAFGWVIIALASIALVYVVAGYLRSAGNIVRRDGWRSLWHHIRIHVLTRKPRNRP